MLPIELPEEWSDFMHFELFKKLCKKSLPLPLQISYTVVSDQPNTTWHGVTAERLIGYTSYAEL